MVRILCWMRVEQMGQMTNDAAQSTQQQWCPHGTKVQSTAFDQHTYGDVHSVRLNMRGGWGNVVWDWALQLGGGKSVVVTTYAVKEASSAELIRVQSGNDSITVDEYSSSFSMETQ